MTSFVCILQEYVIFQSYANKNECQNTKAVNTLTSLVLRKRQHLSKNVSDCDIHHWHSVVFYKVNFKSAKDVCHMECRNVESLVGSNRGVSRHTPFVDTHFPFRVFFDFVLFSSYRTFSKKLND